MQRRGDTNAAVTRSGPASEYAKPATGYRSPQAATVTAGTFTSPLTTIPLMSAGSWTNPKPGGAVEGDRRHACVARVGDVLDGEPPPMPVRGALSDGSARDQRADGNRGRVGWPGAAVQRQRRHREDPGQGHAAGASEADSARNRTCGCPARTAWTTACPPPLGRCTSSSTTSGVVASITAMAGCTSSASPTTSTWRPS